MQQKLKQNTQEWLETRSEYIGASEASIVMGTNPWKNQYTLWEEKIGKKKSSNFQTKAMKEGSLKEKEALSFFNEQYGYSCKDEVFVSKDKNFMRASLDGYDEEKKHGVEIKCPQPKNFKNLCKEIPKYYYAQMQHQMVCSELNTIDFFVYLDKNNYSLRSVERDASYIQEMIEKEEKFWDCVTNCIPVPKIQGCFVERDLNFAELCEVYEELKSYKKEIDEDMEVVWGKIIKKSENMNSYYGKYYLKKMERKGHVDYASIPELKDVDVEKHRKPGCEMWKLQVIE